MFNRLLGMLIEEVPEELSACEFDCTVTRCTARNRDECTLYLHATRRSRDVTQRNPRSVQTEVPAIASVTNELLSTS